MSYTLASSRLEVSAERPLRGFERLSVPLLDFANTHGPTKWALQSFLRISSGNWVYACSKNLWELYGVEQLQSLKPPRGVVLVSNHRSFFDMYVTSAVLYRYTDFMQRMYFPVRSNFFYTSPIGVMVNFAVAAGTMWPPVFRDDRREILNPIGLAYMHQALEKPGSVLGIHPEGTRGKGTDPYEFLPPKPGVGQLVLEAHPDLTILPFFINGLSNTVASEIRRNFKPEGQRGENIRIWFGSPLRAADFHTERDPLVVSRKLMGIIAELGEQDRNRRAPHRLAG
jgi:1-acyl-sn-glycerol-3-phosphate acyltransferase